MASILHYEVAKSTETFVSNLHKWNFFEPQGQQAYLHYTEDISNNNPGGLKGRKMKPKVVVQHENTENPSQCFVHLYKLYISKCPPKRPKGALKSRYCHTLYTADKRHVAIDCWKALIHLSYKKNARTTFGYYQQLHTLFIM